MKKSQIKVNKSYNKLKSKFKSMNADLICTFDENVSDIYQITPIKAPKRSYLAKIQTEQKQLYELPKVEH